jgi:hypothetical protein
MKTKTQNKGGGVLVLVMILVLLVGILGAGLMRLSTGSGVEVSYAINDTRAFWAAEAGIERFKAIVREGVSLPLDQMSPSRLETSLSGVTSNGTYVVIASNYPSYDNDNPALPKKYVVTSCGTSGGAQRIITVCATLQCFAGSHISNFEENRQYSPTEGNIYFLPGDVIDGPVFVNDQLNIAGGSPMPRFLQKVYSSSNSVNYIDGATSAVFEKGVQLGVSFVSANASRWFNGSNITAVSKKAGVSLSGTNSGNWNIIFTNISNVGYVKYAKVGSTNFITKTLSAGSNNVIYVNSNAYVQGVVNCSNVTVAAQNAIYITSDLVYASAISPAPMDVNFNPSVVDDMTMLWASNSVQVLATKDVNIHANILVTSGNTGNYVGFGAYTNWNRSLKSPRPDIKLFGALAQYRRGAVSQGSASGFNKKYKFDGRFGNTQGNFLPYQFTGWRQAGQN